MALICFLCLCYSEQLTLTKSSALCHTFDAFIQTIFSKNVSSWSTCPKQPSEPEIRVTLTCNIWMNLGQLIQLECHMPWLQTEGEDLDLGPSLDSHFSYIDYTFRKKIFNFTVLMFKQSKNVLCMAFIKICITWRSCKWMNTVLQLFHNIHWEKKNQIKTWLCQKKGLAKLEKLLNKISTPVYNVSVSMF